MITQSDPEISWHRTRQRLLAARSGDACFLALPDTGTGFRIAIAYDLDTPPESWTQDDFLSIGVSAENETALRSKVANLARQQHEANSFLRREIEPGTETSWGKAQFSFRYAEGVVRHDTPGHGGFHLDPARNALVHPAYRNDGGWYEEDVEWGKVAATFPLLFTEAEREGADELLRHYEPDAYEQANGVSLAPGDSAAKDERQFRLGHAADLVVVEAIESSHRPGFFECLAARGGDRHEQEQRRFLVPASELEPDPDHIIIDESRHEAYSGPSDFPDFAPVHGLAQPSPTPQLGLNPVTPSEEAAPIRSLAEEREAMRRLDLPEYARTRHGYAVDSGDAAQTRAVLTRGDEELVASQTMSGAWSYRSRTALDQGDILDFEIHRGARTLANARSCVRSELERVQQEQGRLDPAPTAGQTRDEPSPEPDAPGPVQDGKRRRGRGR